MIVPAILTARRAAAAFRHPNRLAEAQGSGAAVGVPVSCGRQGPWTALPEGARRRTAGTCFWAVPPKERSAINPVQTNAGSLSLPESNRNKECFFLLRENTRYLEKRRYTQGRRALRTPVQYRYTRSAGFAQSYCSIFTGVLSSCTKHGKPRGMITLQRFW